MSSASNLVSGDTNKSLDIFVHHLAAETTARVSISSKGAQTNHSSLDPSF
jgi:hypothetical protein